MREAVSEIVAFVKGVKYARFIQNRMIRYAVERQLLVIGEAAHRIRCFSANFGSAHNLDRPTIIGYRTYIKPN